MFADLELARLIDGAEARLCAGIAEAVARARPATGARVWPLAGGLVTFGGVQSPVNKGMAVGLGEPLDLEALAPIEDAWRAAGEPMRVELCAIAEPSIGRALTARGYQLIGFENALGRPLDRPGPAPVVPGLTIEPAASLDEWMHVAVEGFAHPDGGPIPHEEYPRDVLEALFRDLAQVDGFTFLLARIDGAPAGAASLRIDGPVAQLAGAATLPAFRRRGVQGALLETRLERARKAGCALATVTTAPGSVSQANCQRRGFALLYTRAILVREWT